MTEEASGFAVSTSATRRPRPSEKTLSFAALSLWLASLVLTGLAFYAKDERAVGVAILTMGWLSLLIGNLAWFANPLFLWAFIRLRHNQRAVGLALLALLLSLDTFRLSSYWSDEGGGATTVYAYGWGVMLWIAALCVLVAAAGTGRVESRIKAGGPEEADEWARPIGFALCIAVLAAAGYLAIRDRQHASSAERERLSGLVFKRGPVCGAGEPAVLQPLGHALGPVEVRLPGDMQAADTPALERLKRLPSAVDASPFDRPTSLLQWGLPVVRVAGRDYSYTQAGDDQILTSVPASAPAAAILSVSVFTLQGRRQIGAKLVEQATGRMVFDQVWKQEAAGPRYCPDYSAFPDEGQQPRKLVAEALGVQVRSAHVLGQGAGPTRPTDNRANAVIVSNTDGLGSTSSGSPRPTRGAIPQGDAAGARRLWSGNRNCPENVGWSGEGVAGRTGVDTGWPFMVGDRAFYPGSRQHHNALCAGSHVYLYSGTSSNGTYYLSLEKRRLTDFQQTWSGTVVIKDEYLAKGDDVLRVDTVNEEGDGLTIGLAKELTGRTAVVKAPLRLSR